MRLIDADELIKTIKANHYLLKSHLNSTDYGMFTIGIQYAINEQTTVDAVPVVHGRWVDYMPILGAGDLQIRCSECGLTYDAKTLFCPNCGAKMDLEASHE